MSSIGSIGSSSFATQSMGAYRSSDAASMADKLFSKLDSISKGYIEQSDLESALAGISSVGITAGASAPEELVTEVIDAFRDVQRAQADRERLQNEAEARSQLYGAFLKRIEETARQESDRYDAAVENDPETKEIVSRLEFMGDEEQLPTGEELASELERFLREHNDDEASGPGFG